MFPKFHIIFHTCKIVTRLKWNKYQSKVLDMLKYVILNDALLRCKYAMLKRYHLTLRQRQRCETSLFKAHFIISWEQKEFRGLTRIIIVNKITISLHSQNLSFASVNMLKMQRHCDKRISFPLHLEESIIPQGFLSLLRNSQPIQGAQIDLSLKKCANAKIVIIFCPRPLFLCLN